LKGRTVGLLGLSFKPNTDDLRDAPSLEIAERLLGMGARVKAYDPISMPVCRRQHPALKVRYCESAAEVAEGADALVLITEWPEFAALDLKALAAAMNTRVLIDGRNLFSAKDATDAGFDYTGFGRAAVPPRGGESTPGSNFAAV
jgi:UDPglucose 6-dehydrogenase